MNLELKVELGWLVGQKSVMVFTPKKNNVILKTTATTTTITTVTLIISLKYKEFELGRIKFSTKLSSFG